MRLRIFLALVCLSVWPIFLLGQARPLVTTSSPQLSLPGAAGDVAILGSVSLGRQRTFTMFNVQATGTIKPDPDLSGAAFQVQFLICDQPDCSGEIKSGARMLPDIGPGSAQLIATKSFGVSSRNVAPVVLTDYQLRDPGAPLYLAVALKALHTPGTISFTGKLNLLRVDVMP